MTRVSTPPTPTTGQQSSPQTNVAHDKIAMRAYELWCKRGRPHGTDRQDWLQAETELRAEAQRNSSSGTMRR